jgi:tRNAThr (cytosine32-N3)-methyltransferase
MYPVPPHGKGILHSSVWDVTQPPVASQSTVQQPASTQSKSDPSTKEDPETQTKQSSLPEGVEPNSVDIAIMIFVLSALHPLEWQRAIANVYKVRRISLDRDPFAVLISRIL